MKEIVCISVTNTLQIIDRPTLSSKEKDMPRNSEIFSISRRLTHVLYRKSIDKNLYFCLLSRPMVFSQKKICRGLKNDKCKMNKNRQILKLCADQRFLHYIFGVPPLKVYMNCLVLSSIIIFTLRHVIFI